MRRRWGVGCVFFEVLSLYPLFPGTNELDQVKKLCGGSRVAVWPLLSHIMLNLGVVWPLLSHIMFVVWPLLSHVMFIIESGRHL